MPELVWRRSPRFQGNIEMATTEDTVYLRNAASPWNELEVGWDDWECFIAAIQFGEFNGGVPDAG